MMSERGYMIEPTKDTLEREGFWTCQQSMGQDLSDALEEFQSKIAQQTESLLQGILKASGILPDGLPAEEEIKRRCVRVRSHGPVVADRLFRQSHNAHCLEREIGLEGIGNSTFVDDYLLDGKSVLFVVHGFHGNVLTVRFVMVGGGEDAKPAGKKE